jgi:RND family efflux transporter MFP subunit
MKTLMATRAVAREVVDEQESKVAAATSHVTAAKAAVQTSKAELEVKQGKVAQAEAGVATARANTEAAVIELEKARYTLSQTKITAPFDGVVTHRNVAPGQYLRGGAAANQPPVLTIQGTDRLRFVVDVTETAAEGLEPGVPADLQFAGESLDGLKVSRVGFAVEPTNGTIRVEIDVPNPKQKLRPGMWGRVNFHIKPTANALRLPRSCLVVAQGGRYAVYVVRDGKAHRTLVKVGNLGEKDAEVLSGLKPTDLVVHNPEKLKGDDVAVEVKPK